MVYLLNINWLSRSGELGLMIGEKSLHRKGIGEFATRQMLDHAFFDLNLQRVYLTTLARNTIAIRLYKKVGFVEEGLLRQAAFKRGRFDDVTFMSCLAEDYTKK